MNDESKIVILAKGADPNCHVGHTERAWDGLLAAVAMAPTDPHATRRAVATAIGTTPAPVSSAEILAKWRGGAKRPAAMTSPTVTAPRKEGNVVSPDAPLRASARPRARNGGRGR